MKNILFILLVLTGSINAQNKFDLNIQFGHSGSCTVIDYSPNGKYLASGSYDHTVKIWDIQTLKEVRTISKHKQIISSVEFSSNSEYLVTSDGDSIFLWDVKTGNEIRNFGSGKVVKFSPDSKNILLVTKNLDDKYFLKTYEISTGKLLLTIEKTNSWFEKICYTKDGKYILATTGTNNVKIYDALNGNDLFTFKAHEDSERESYKTTIKAIAVSPNNKYFATASNDNTVKVYDLLSRKEIHTLNGHEWTVNSVIFSPDSKQVISGALDKTIRIWDVSTGKEIKKITDNVYYVECLSISPDGENIISETQSKGIGIWDTGTGLVKKIIEKKTQRVTDVCFIDSLKNIIFSSQKLSSGFGDNVNSKLGIFNIENTTNLQWPDTTFDHFTTTPDKKIILSAKMGVINIINPASLKIVKMIDTHRKYLKRVAISPDGKSVAAITSEDTCIVWDVASGKEKQKINKKFTLILNISLSDDKKNLYLADFNGMIYHWDIQLNKEIKHFMLNYNKFLMWDYLYTSNYNFNLRKSSLEESKTIELWRKNETDPICNFKDNGNLHDSLISTDNKYSLSTKNEFDVNVWELETKKVFTTFSIIKTEIHNTIAFSNDNKYTFWAIENKINVSDNSTGQIIKEFTGLKETVLQIVVSSNSKLMAVEYPNLFQVWDIEKGTLIRTFNYLSRTSSLYSLSMLFTTQDKKILTSSEDGTVRIWDISNGSSIILMNHKNNKDWLVITDDGYWDASPNGGEMIAVVKGMECWNIDQFATKYNRPDIILQRLESVNKNLITHYYNQYKKRLRKLGITEQQMVADLHVPETKILDNRQADKMLELKVKFSDDKYSLKQYNIYVNDVPLFGIGKAISGNTKDIIENIELISGLNKIEVSCMNDKGAESFRALTYSSYNKPVEKNLYLLAFGVSKYNNSVYNLAYADKDALDFSKVIETYKGKGYANVYTKILVNEQVTPENIKASKDFVKNAKPDDTFILFIAGHGMHDTDPEATYYYLTSNADVNNLKGTAADFETIEDLLQGIPPRNKLFLMDACESGEIDEEDKGQMLAAATGSGMASRGFKSNSTTNIKKSSYLYQKDRYIYNDLARRSGAIVFSSSKGGELSYERSDIENGLFTEYIMKALSTTEADKDENGEVSTDELRIYVSDQVAKASDDLQHPTVDRDNIYQKFGFGVK